MTNKQLSILIIVVVTSFMGSFLVSSINIALPSIEKSFSIDAITLSWVITSFLLSSGMFLLPSGRWGDLFGIKLLFKIGIVVFTLSSFFCGIAWSGAWLIIFRFISGISAALTNATGSAILVSAFPPKQRGRVLGISVSGVYLGLAFGPFFGGLMTQTFGWQSIFYLSVVFGLISTVIAFVYLGKDATHERSLKKMDLKGAGLYMLGLVALVYGSAHIPALTGWLMMGAGVISLIVFWKMESRTDSPIFNTRLFERNRLFAFSNLAALINYSATYAIVFLLSLYLQKIQALSPRVAGTILVAQPAVMAIFSPVAGRLSDSVQPRYLSSAGMAMCAIGLLIFGFLTETTPIWFIVLTLIWVGFGFALFSSPNMNTIMSSVEKTEYGVASGTAATMRVLGQMTAMTIVTLFFASLFDGHSIEFVDNAVFMRVINWGFWCFSLICFSGIYFSFKRGKIIR